VSRGNRGPGSRQAHGLAGQGSGPLEDCGDLNCYALQAARSGDPFAVQRLLGHANPKMGTRYVQDICYVHRRWPGHCLNQDSFVYSSKNEPTTE